MGLHVLGALGFVLVELPLWVRSLGLLLIGLSYSWERTHCMPLLKGQGIRALILEGADDWLIETKQGTFPARLLPSSSLWRRAVFLRFEVEGRRIAVWLPADALPGDAFRRLRAGLGSFR